MAGDSHHDARDDIHVQVQVRKGQLREVQQVMVNKELQVGVGGTTM